MPVIININITLAKYDSKPSAVMCGSLIILPL